MDNALASPAFAPPALPDREFDVFHLAQAVCARICHDVAGPLGALGGILEQALDGQDEEARTLATELVALLASRLRLLRCAWGGDEAPDIADLHDMLPGLPGARHLRLDTATLGGTMPEALRRAVPALLLLAAAALPRGGLITLADRGEKDGSFGLHVAIEGPGAAWPGPLEACAARAGSVQDHSPRGVAVPLACLAAREAGALLTVLSPVRLTLQLA